MPIHLIWGDDAAASDRAIETLIKEIVDPAWSSINLSRLDGENIAQANQAMNEVRTPPFGSGGRIVLVKRSPFCNNCPSDLGSSFEQVLDLIPDQTHLVLNNPNKPDGRLKTTKALQKLIKSKQANEKSFVLPSIWDGAGQIELVKRTANELGLELEADAASCLVEAIGNDSSRISSELSKLALHAGIAQQSKDAHENNVLITSKAISSLIHGISTNALQVGDSLLQRNTAEAIARIDALLDQGEPPLKILATLTGQVRGWLWVTLLDDQGEKDVSVIAKAAGIGNPKRIYVMRKQLQGRSPKQFLLLLSCLLEVEVALKRGVSPRDSFRDGLIGNCQFK